MFKMFTSLFLFLYIGVACAQNVATFIPPKAFNYRDIIKVELDRYLPSLPRYNYIPALIEHESCQHLRHVRCWSSASQLKSKREFGVGLGMLTKAYNADGSVRFDKLTELRTRYRRELAELSWGTITQRPDVQIRAIVLMTRDVYDKLYDIPNTFERLAMTDAAYNGGYGGLQKQRRHCSLVKGCNPNIWFGHLEKNSIKSRKILYGNRSAADINTHHVHDVLKVRMLKYERAGYLPH